MKKLFLILVLFFMPQAVVQPMFRRMGRQLYKPTSVVISGASHFSAPKGNPSIPLPDAKKQPVFQKALKQICYIENVTPEKVTPEIEELLKKYGKLGPLGAETVFYLDPCGCETLSESKKKEILKILREHKIITGECVEGQGLPFVGADLTLEELRKVRDQVQEKYVEMRNKQFTYFDRIGHFVIVCTAGLIIYIVIDRVTGDRPEFVVRPLICYMVASWLLA